MVHLLKTVDVWNLEWTSVWKLHHAKKSGKIFAAQLFFVWLVQELFTSDVRKCNTGYHQLTIHYFRVKYKMLFRLVLKQ